MKRFTLFLFALTLQTVYAQKNIDPTPEDIATAKKLREKYGKDDVAILEATETITFELAKKNEGVSVTKNVKEKLMNIGHRADIQKAEFYDSESEIQEFSMKFRNEKAAYFEVKDEFYKSDDLFYNDYRVKYMNVDFPVQGYTYNYELNKKYNDIKYFTSLYFHDAYPTLKKEFVITVPDWLEVEFKEFNFAGYAVRKSQKPAAKGKATVYTFSLENMDGFPKEDSSPGPSYLYPHILVIARSYTAEGKKNTLFSATGDLYKWYKSLVDTMDEKPEAMKEKVKELTANAKTDEEKIKNIYYWVQDNIRYIAFEDGLAGFRPDASQNVFQKRYGDCKGMANLTRQMLKLAGYDARLTWIGTKRIAYNYTIPSLGVDNHMICTLFKDGKKYFLDGTEKYNSFGEYAERIQGKEVMIEDGEKFIIEKVPVAAASANKEIYNASFKIDNEALTGKISSSMKGESRAYFLYGYNNTKNDKKENALQYYISRGDKNFSVSNIVTSDLTNRDKTLTIEYNAGIRNRVSSFDNEMYIDLDYLEEFAGYDFKERKTDYEFSFKKDYESNITLEIPAGYTVTRLPEPLTVSTDDYAINVSYTKSGNTILYKKHFIIKNGAIKKADFTNWNAAIAGLKNLYSETITLTKQ
ncbi:transglutaminase-like domain-containing protein [Flavobacterium sp. MFBS3-15]|uniref:transglutaminase-like domain-containing protein n=1 Tax=Flavobacterium sp. MFBS3-15 TaxID=2989816 RepID=UPI0022360E7B|nr:transglutaminase-like domain-containing protein [Flavobacterium sp. MFBS3-15]MCW4470877.1 transglutaminase-like domain-containing protein [Flavobacterium sp. MFBS3-15]